MRRSSDLQVWFIRDQALPNPASVQISHTSKNPSAATTALNM